MIQRLALLILAVGGCDRSGEEPVEITVAPSPWAPPGRMAFEFGPNGARFDPPIAVRVPHNLRGGNLRVVSITSEGDVEIHETVASDAHSVTALTSHFTTFYVEEFPGSSGLRPGLVYRLFTQPRLLDTKVKVVKIFGKPFVVSGSSATGQWWPIGKGSMAEFWSSPKNLILIHGFSSDALDFGGEHDLVNGLWEAYDRIAIYQYRSGESVASNAAWLRDRILENAAAGFQTDIAAHSMGGLVARHMIESLGGLDGKIGRLFTLGTPHQGVPLADLATFYDTDDFQLIPGLHDLRTDGVGPQLNAAYTDGSVAYYLIAGNSDAFWIPGPDDGLVGLPSALGVPVLVPPEASAVFDSGHGDLHSKAVLNGVRDQILAWLAE